MNNFVDWKRADPKYEGMYLVAVHYPNGLGELELLIWRGTWLTLYDEEPIPGTYKIIGFITTTEIVHFFHGNWPEWDSVD